MKQTSSVNRIAIIGPAHPLRGGIANFNEALALALIQSGYQVELFSFKLQYPSFLFPGTSQFDNGPAPKNLTIHSIINSVNPLNWIVSAIKIARYKPDLIVVRYWLPFMGPCLGTINFILQILLSKKIIAITDNIIPHEKRIGDYLFTKFFVKTCHGFIAMSNSVLNDLSKFTSNKHKLFLPHPLYNIFGPKVERSVALKYLNLSDEFRYILFFGFIRKYKGLELLIKAFAKTNLKDVKLIIAGEFYEDPAPYLQLIEKLQLTEQIILKTQFIPSEEVRYYFAVSDLVAQTYLSATQSGVAQIAYNYLVPLLVTNVGGLSEIVPHQKVGYACNINDDEIAHCIIDFFTNNRYPEFVKNMNEERKRFEWDFFIKGLINLYEQIN